MKKILGLLNTVNKKILTKKILDYSNISWQEEKNTWKH